MKALVDGYTDQGIGIASDEAQELSVISSHEFVSKKKRRKKNLIQFKIQIVLLLDLLARV